MRERNDVLNLPPDASLSQLAMYVADGELCNLMEGGMAGGQDRPASGCGTPLASARAVQALLEWVDGSL